MAATNNASGSYDGNDGQHRDGCAPYQYSHDDDIACYDEIHCGGDGSGNSYTVVVIAFLAETLCGYRDADDKKEVFGDKEGGALPFLY